MGVCEKGPHGKRTPGKTGVQSSDVRGWKAVCPAGSEGKGSQTMVCPPASYVFVCASATRTSLRTPPRRAEDRPCFRTAAGRSPWPWRAASCRTSGTSRSCRPPRGESQSPRRGASWPRPPPRVRKSESRGAPRLSLGDSTARDRDLSSFVPFQCRALHGKRLDAWGGRIWQWT